MYNNAESGDYMFAALLMFSSYAALAISGIINVVRINHKHHSFFTEHKLLSKTS